MDGSIAVLGGICGLVGAIAGIVGIVTARRSAKDAQRTQDTITEFEILKGTVAVLQDENTRRSDEIRLLRREQAVDRSNIDVLRRHILEHVDPMVPFPQLRVVNGDG
jgi:hypothetical protein